MEDKSWKNEGLSSFEKGLLEKTARNYKTTTDMDCDGFHPKTSLDVSNATGKGNYETLSKNCNSVGDDRNKLARRCFC